MGALDLLVVAGFRRNLDELSADLLAARPGFTVTRIGVTAAGEGR